MNNFNDNEEIAGGITLKSLLQNPLMNLPKEQIVACKNKDGDQTESDKQKQKEKELELAYDPFGPVNPMAAFLGPKLWDDSMLMGTGENDLKFEFMDLDEFLNENSVKQKEGAAAMAASAKESMVADTDDAFKEAVSILEQATKLVQSESDTNEMDMDNSPTATQVPTLLGGPIINPLAGASPLRSPSPVQVSVQYEVSSTDVALATIPGQDTYDPRAKQFTEEELKPQPIIKKSKKVFVTEERKDDKYWERRRKNNVAAKRSRDARRVKENQIVLRAGYLQKENSALKDEVLNLKKDNMTLKSVVSKLEQELREATMLQL